MSGDREDHRSPRWISTLSGLKRSDPAFVLRTAAAGPLFYDLAVDAAEASNVATLEGFEPSIFTLKG
jgi:hypothetical protein